MKKFFFAFAIFCLGYTSLNAQRGQAVYAELLGNGLLFSFNYDIRLRATPDGPGARLGIGYVGSPDDGGILLIPFQGNWLLGKNDRYFELGLGLTIATGNGEFFDESLSEVIGTMTFGYRKQPADGGFMWKIAITPIIAEGIFWPYYGGLALGYAF